MKKLTSAQREALASTDASGFIEPLGRYRTLDALERAGLVVAQVPVRGTDCRVWEQPETLAERYDHHGRRDLFKITEAGRAALREKT